MEEMHSDSGWGPCWRPPPACGTAPSLGLGVRDTGTPAGSAPQAAGAWWSPLAGGPSDPVLASSTPSTAARPTSSRPWKRGAGRPELGRMAPLAPALRNAVRRSRRLLPTIAFNHDLTTAEL
eukprot:9703125-Lingulodinium_polyedra.AAC.1